MPQRDITTPYARSVFSGGRDALLEHLAARDAAQQQAQDRELQRTLLAERKAAQEKDFGLRERGMRGQEAEAEERRGVRKAAADKEAAEAAASQQARDAFAALLDQYDAAQTPEEKKRIGMYIINSGGKLLPQEPTPAKPGRHTIDGVMVDDDGKVIYRSPTAGQRGASAEPKDDPGLPLGTKRWLDSIAQRGVSLEQARGELSGGWGQQLQAHPRALLPKAAEYLGSLYEKAPTGIPQDPAGQSPLRVPQAAPPPSAGRSGGAGGGGVLPEPTPQAQAAVPDEVAQARLIQEGITVTPENLAIAKQLIANEAIAGEGVVVNAQTGNAPAIDRLTGRGGGG